MNFTSFQLYQNLTNPNSSSGTAGGSQNLIDVRDVALGHALVLEHPEAGGERFIISNGPFSWAELRKSPAYHWFFRYFDVYFALHVDCFAIIKGTRRSMRVSRASHRGLPRGSLHRSPKSWSMVAKRRVCLGSSTVPRVKRQLMVSNQSTSSTPELSPATSKVKIH